MGAGPAGIAVGLEAQRRGLKALLVEQGAICNTIYRFPQHMRFFSTADLLEFPGIPLVIQGDKPRSFEVLNYFTRIAVAANLPIATHERVLKLTHAGEQFFVQTERRELRSRAVVIATGTYDHANLLDVPGEELDKVSHYYSGPQPYIGTDVLVVGGKNSAAEAALELWRAGARVTLVHRGESLRESSIKYWILPDLKNRLAERAIAHSWDTTITRIEPDRVLLHMPDGERWIANDFVLALTGYHPDYRLLEQCGIRTEGEQRAPVLDSASLESGVPGLYVAGVLSAGADPSRVFVENSRHHGRVIVDHLAESGRLSREC